MLDGFVILVLAVLVIKILAAQHRDFNRPENDPMLERMRKNER